MPLPTGMLLPVSSSKDKMWFFYLSQLELKPFDNICHQHIRDDDNCYKEEELDRGLQSII